MSDRGLPWRATTAVHHCGDDFVDAGFNAGRSRVRKYRALQVVNKMQVLQRVQSLWTRLFQPAVWYGYHSCRCRFGCLQVRGDTRTTD